MVDRLDYNVVGIAILLLLCWMGYSLLACRGAEVWSDDFNDGDYDEWTVCPNSMVNPQSTWSAVHCNLQIEQEDSGTITHPSSVAYGTWSFDFKANETIPTLGLGDYNHLVFSIGFISNDINDIATVVNPQDWSCYGLKCEADYSPEGNEYELRLTKWHVGRLTTIDSYDDFVPNAGWHHMEVTRTEAGQFSVYNNGSLVLQGVDTEIDTAELFVVSLRDWHMIDNIIVDNVPRIDWLPIAIIGVSAVVIIAVLVIILKRR